MKPRNIFSLAIFFIGFLLAGNAQISPVSANFNIAPPSSVYLSDYTLPGSNKLQLNINLLDENEDFIDVFLRVEIKGNGVTLRSNPEFNYAPLTLNSGINMLSGSEIEQYLNPVNMIIDGIDPQEFIQSTVLPEGMYTFCVTVVDFLRRDKELSMQSCNVATLLKNNPPMVISPQCGLPVVAGSIQNLLFQWQANHDNSIMAEYSLKIVQVLPGIEPNDAMNGANTPIVEGLTSSMNQILYGPDQPELEIGATYAYRVDVEDMEGLTTFENDGIGEVCVFEYGYEMGGVVNLISPDIGGSMKGDGNTVFQWGGPTNARPGDPVYYRFKIVEVFEDQDPVEAMMNNGLRIDEETDIAPNLSAYNYILDQDLGTEAKFAWQVEAYIDDQMVAASEVRAFGTRPFIDHFSAGGKRVEILSVTNQDPESLAGNGTIQLLEDGPATPISFSDLTIGIYPSGNILEEGAMISPIEGGLSVPLPNDAGLKAEFLGTHVVLNTQELRLRGHAEWAIPFATTQTGSVAKVKSQMMDVDYNTLKIQDDIAFEKQSFEMLDPYGYVIDFEESSKFVIRENQFELVMTGTVRLPESIKTSSGNAFVFPFENITDLAYFEVASYSDAESFLIFENDKVRLKPTSVVFDFAGDRAIENTEEVESWKGLYFPTFNVTFPQNFDSSGQVVIVQEFSQDFDDSGDSRAWLSADGFTLNISSDITGGYTFNEFKSSSGSWKIEMDEGSVSDSYLKGSIKIPLLGSDEFNYTIPFSNDGLAIGTLDDELEDYEVVLAKGDKEREMTLTIHSASFDDRNKLKCAASVDWPFLNAQNGGPENSGIYHTGFNLFGDGNIGFGGANNMIPLNSTAQGRLGGAWQITVDSIGAGIADGSYFFIASTIVNLGNQLAGEKGITRTYFSTSRDVAGDIEIKTKEFGNSMKGKLSYLKGNIQIPDLTIWIPEIIRIQSSGIEYTANDSIWGTSFKGKLSVDIFKPKKVNLVADVIVGHHVESDIAFFYCEVGAGKVSTSNAKDDGVDATTGKKNRVAHFLEGAVTDTTKKELQLKLGPIAFTSIRLKIFHNLEYVEDAKGKVTFQPVPAGSNSWGFGGGLGGQFDKGKEFKMTCGGFGSTKDGNLQTLSFNVDGTIMDDIDFNGSVLLMFDVERYQVSAGVNFESPLCVETQVWVDVDIPNEKVVVDLGKRTQKINISQGGCVGIGGEGWFHIAIDEAKDSIGMELGLGFVARFKKESDWFTIIPALLEARGVLVAKVGVGLFTNVSVEWMSGETVWYCRNVGVYVDAFAGIDVEINTPSGGQVIPIASVAIAGDVQLDIIPAPVSASGKLKGTVTVMGVSAEIEFKFSGLVIGGGEA